MHARVCPPSLALATTLEGDRWVNPTLVGQSRLTVEPNLRLGSLYPNSMCEEREADTRLQWLPSSKYSPGRPLSCPAFAQYRHPSSRGIDNPLAL